MKHDLVVVWPNHLDYPPFRKFIHNNRRRFETIIIVFTEHHIPGFDYRSVIRRWLNSEVFLQSKTNIVVEEANNPNGADWRTHAIRRALKNARSDWVCFMEQDFFANWPKLFQKVDDALERQADVFGFYEESTKRLHPAFLGMKRDVLFGTRLDFAPYGDRDHFGGITVDIEAMPDITITTFEDMGLKQGVDWYHMQGLTHNYQLVQTGKPPVFKVEEFLIYNAHARAVAVEQFAPFIELTYKVEKSVSSLANLLNYP